MRHFATLAIAALLVAPAAFAQSPLLERSASFTGTNISSFQVNARGAVDDTLYAQLDGAGSQSGYFLSENFDAANSVADSYLADDFVVPDGATWSVGKVSILGFYSVQAGAETSFVKPETFNVIIWADENGDPGDEVFRKDEVVPVVNDGGELTLGAIDIEFDTPDDPFDGPIDLTEGTYWLTVQANLDTFSDNGTRFLWYASDADRSELGELLHFFNYGGGLAGIGTCSQNWGVRINAECGSTDSGTGGNLTFAIISTTEGGGGVTSVADARAAGVGETVTFEGVVTRAEGAFLYIQDETGGLTIRQSSGDVFDQIASGSLTQGASLRVSGVLSEFRGLLQINGDDLISLEGLGGEDVPAPQVITLAELSANGEDYEGELVTISDVSFDTPPSQYSAGTNYAITDASGTGTLRIVNAGDTELEGTDFVGNPVTVTGVVGQFTTADPAIDGYQIQPIYNGDIRALAVAAESDLEAGLSLGAVAPNPSAARASVTVTLQEAGPVTVAVYDLLGRQVATVLDGALSAGTSSLDLEVGALPAGTYMVRLSANGGTVVRAFTVAR